MARHEPETEFLANGGKDHAGFHQRERVADALTRTAAEGEIRKARQLLRKTAFPTFGTELERSIEPSHISVHDPLRKRYAITAMHRVACDLVFFSRQPRHAPRCRVEPQ